MDPEENPPIDPELKRADEHLRELEAELAAESKPEVTQADDKGETIEQPERPGEGGKAAESVPDDQTDAEKTEAKEIETATAEADKEGKELVKDEAGKPKRDDKGQFVRQDKKAPEAPITLSKEELDKYSKWLKTTQGQYAQDNLKRLIRWDNIKAEEKRVKTEAEQAAARHAAAVKQFNTEVANWKAEQAANTPTPEKYEAFANKCEQNATQLEAQAIIAENAGDTEKAAQLRSQALVAKEDSRRAKAQAEHVRKNPPADAKKLQETFTHNQQQWIGKASTDFPEFKVKDSPVQKVALEYYHHMAKQEPAAAKLPGFIYFCAERAAMKVAADRVPVLEKELGELRAKVKEQDGLLHPSPRGAGGVQKSGKGPKAWDQLSEEEQYAQLQAEAAQLR